MEVCGGHTHTIYRHGIEHVLPETVELVHGPGLPGVRDPDGPGRRRHRGRRDARRDLHVVRRHDARAGRATGTCSRPRRAAPTCASSTRRSTRCASRDRDTRTARSCSSPSASRRPRRRRRSRCCGRASWASPTSACSATTSRSCRRSRRSSSRPTSASTASSGPGHVSTVVGNRPYRFVPEQYGKPLVTAGFEPLDILQAIAMLLAQIREGRCEVENQYTRVVRDEGNPRALAGAGRGVRAAAALRVARARVHLAERAASCGPSSPRSTPSCTTTCRACGSPIRRRASAARC